MKIKYLMLLLLIIGNVMIVFSMMNDRHGSTGPGGGTAGLIISDPALDSSDLNIEQPPILKCLTINQVEYST